VNGSTVTVTQLPSPDRAATVLRRPWLAVGAGAVAVVAGGLLVGWIVVQPAFIRTVRFFHPLFIAIGLAFLLAGRDALRHPPFRRGAS